MVIELNIFIFTYVNVPTYILKCHNGDVEVKVKHVSQMKFEDLCLYALKHFIVKIS